MKHELTLWYSVHDHGDGSAYPHFMESNKLVEWDQEHLDEGWGESCTGSITVYSDSPITTDKEVKTALEYLVEMIEDERKKKDINDFIEEFFPNGTPKMDVEIEEIKKQTEYVYNLVTVDGKLVGKFFRRVDESGKKFEELINKYTPKTLPDNTSMTTQSLSAEQVKQKILSGKGQFIKVKWQSDPTPAAAFKKTVKLKKITEGVVRSGIDYSNLEVVKEGIEDGSRGPVGELPFGNWKVVDGVSQFPYILTHRPKGSDVDIDYIRLYPSIHRPHSIFFVDGVETTKEEFAKYLTPSDAKKLLNPSGEDVPLCFTIKASNILSIPEEVTE